jgi:hypothetical protein
MSGRRSTRLGIGNEPGRRRWLPWSPRTTFFVLLAGGAGLASLVLLLVGGVRST